MPRTHPLSQGGAIHVGASRLNSPCEYLTMDSYVVPLVAILFGVLLLGETVTLGMGLGLEVGVGMVLIVFGVLIVNKQR